MKVYLPGAKSTQQQPQTYYRGKRAIANVGHNRAVQDLSHKIKFKKP